MKFFSTQLTEQATVVAGLHAIGAPICKFQHEVMALQLLDAHWTAYVLFAKTFFMLLIFFSVLVLFKLKVSFKTLCSITLEPPHLPTPFLSVLIFYWFIRDFSRSEIQKYNNYQALPMVNITFNVSQCRWIEARFSSEPQTKLF